MTDRRLLDTNVVVRFFVRDNEQQYQQAARLFEACDMQTLKLELMPAVLAECVFVLESFYDISPPDISQKLLVLINRIGTSDEDQTIHLTALNLYENTHAQFVDCMIAATAMVKHLTVASFDRDFRKFREIRVSIEP